MSFTNDRTLRIVAAAASLVLVCIMVLRTSSAAFTDSTQNSGNSWEAGSVSLTDDDAGSAMFTVSNMTPNTSVEKCITVTYNGTVTTSGVKLYGQALSGTGLDTFLQTKIEEGSGGGFGDCTGFTATGTLYNDTLASFGATKTDYSTGVGTWVPTAAGQTKTYRFTITLADDNAAQGKTATNGVFTWEVQS
jgi:hypothetical protein